MKAAEAFNAEEGVYLSYTKLCQDAGQTTPDTPSGYTYIYRNQFQSYTSSTTCSGPSRQYQFYWGDGYTTTTGWVAAGTQASASHAWAGSGYYYIKARATVDGYSWTPWSSNLQIYVDDLSHCPPHCSPTP